MSTEEKAEPLSWLQLERVCPMPEIEELTSLSSDTIVRRFSDRLIRLSPRRQGMKLRHVLKITNGE